MAELALWGGEAEVKGAVAVDWYDAAEKQALMEVLESRSLAGSGVAVCHRTRDPKLREKYADMGVQVLLESPKV